MRIGPDFPAGTLQRPRYYLSNIKPSRLPRIDYFLFERRRGGDSSTARIGCHIGFFDTTTNSVPDLRCEFLLKPFLEKQRSTPFSRLRYYLFRVTLTSRATINPVGKTRFFEIELSGSSEFRTLPLLCITSYLHKASF